MRTASSSTATGTFWTVGADGRRFRASPASVDAMGRKREPDDREKVLSAKEQKAALRRRREILDALMKVLRGS